MVGIRHIFVDNYGESSAGKEFSVDKWEGTPGREHYSANVYSSGTCCVEVSKRNTCQEGQFGGRDAQINKSHALRAVKRGRQGSTWAAQRSVTEFIVGSVSSEL